MALGREIDMVYQVINLPKASRDKLSSSINSIPRKVDIVSNNKWLHLKGKLCRSVPKILGESGMFSRIQHMLKYAEIGASY